MPFEGTPIFKIAPGDDDPIPTSPFESITSLSFVPSVPESEILNLSLSELSIPTEYASVPSIWNCICGSPALGLVSTNIWALAEVSTVKFWSAIFVVAAWSSLTCNS